jgi:hypothetical protein
MSWGILFGGLDLGDEIVEPRELRREAVRDLL